MRRVTRAPMQYIQGKNEILSLPDNAGLLGDKVFAVIDKYILTNYGDDIRRRFDGKAPALVLEQFGGDCTAAEVDRLQALVIETGCNVIAGIGGGKAIDAAKAVAHLCKLPVVVVPTAASTDAPCSSISVLYDSKGKVEQTLYLDKAPDVVIVDSLIIAQAPLRLLVSGMGDALSTYYETRACLQSQIRTDAGGVCSGAAMAMARACRDNLFTDGYKAMLAADSFTVSTALETIIETNIYMSGIGFESGGHAAAHAVHDGMTGLAEFDKALHGEKVAFGTIVQLVLENAADNEIFTVMDFCRTVGLPTTLKALGMEKPTADKLVKLAEASCLDSTSMQNMPFPVTPDDVVSAIIVADKLGQ